MSHPSAHRITVSQQFFGLYQITGTQRIPDKGATDAQSRNLAGAGIFNTKTIEFALFLQHGKIPAPCLAKMKIIPDHEMLDV